MSQATRTAFVRGFVALLPLWAGAIPFALVYAVAARDAGLSAAETVGMSLTVFSAAAQVTAVTLVRLGAPAQVIIVTGLLLNLHLVLLGLAIGRREALRWPLRLLVAFLLTDGAYGVMLASGTDTVAFLLGAGASMYVVWNLFTLVGVIGGGLLPDLRWLGLDLVVPLMFLALLAPRIRNWSVAAVVALAASITLLMTSLGLGALAVLTAGLTGALAGAWLPRPASSDAPAGPA